MHGARPWLALIAVPLLVIGWTEQFTLVGDAASRCSRRSAASRSGGCSPASSPLLWLKAAIVAMAIVDSILVFGNQLQAPNAVLNAAVPAAGLPQLQYLDLHHASLGYGDVFVAGVLGGVLAAARHRQWPAALLLLGLSLLWDLCSASSTRSRRPCRSPSRC